MFVVNPEYWVLFKIFVGANSGSCIKLSLDDKIPILLLSHDANINESFNPCVPPPTDILKGTPICLSFIVFNCLGIISSTLSIMKNNLPFMYILKFPVL